MSDSFDKDWDEEMDEELSMAFREDPALAGWEFTPAMQESVLDQIRSGEKDGRSPAPARLRSFRWVLPKPLIWTAVAAAAFVMVLRVGPGMMPMNQKASEPKADSAAPARQMASAPVGSAAKPAAPATEATPATNGAAADRSAKSVAQAPAANAPGEERAGDTKNDGEASAFKTAAAPTTTLAAPTITAVPVPKRMAAGGDLLIEVIPGMVRGYSSQGELRWERPLEGVTVESRVWAVSPDGSRIALLTQTEQSVRLWVLDSQGRPLYTETLGAMPDEVGFVDGNLRLVVNGEAQIRVIPQAP